MASNGTEGGVRKRSHRVQLACEPCKAAKLKCDRKLPICEQCKYTSKGLRYITATQKPDKTESMMEKIERLERFVNQIKDRVPSPATLLADQHHREEPEHAEPAADSHASRGNLKVYGSGNAQWMGPAHWESIVEDLSDVKAFVELEQSPEQDWPDSDGTPLNLKQPVEGLLLEGTPSPSSNDDLTASLPAKHEMDRYIAAWYNVMDPSRIIIHAPTFQQQYQAFWSSLQDVEWAWLALLCATGALGAEICCNSSNDVSQATLAQHLRKLAVRAFALADCTRPKPFLIEALLIYITSLLYRDYDVSPTVWHLEDLAMRLCFQAGYHRDPSWSPSMSAYDCEMRRRVWMVACQLDVWGNYTTGQVIPVDRRLCDTKPPSNLHDADFSPEHVPPSRSLEDYTLVQAKRFYSKVTSLFADATALSQAVVPPNKSEVHTMSERLQQARNQLPKNLKMVSLDESFLDSPYLVADRLRLEFAHQRALCVLYRRYIGEQQCLDEHAICLAGAETIVYHCVAMLEVAQPGGQLAIAPIERHVHDFNLAAMLICTALKNEKSAASPSHDPGWASRVCDLLRRGCQLWSARVTPSPKARMGLAAVMHFLTSQQQATGLQSASGNLQMLAGDGASTGAFQTPEAGGYYPSTDMPWSNTDLATYEQMQFSQSGFNLQQLFPLEDPGTNAMFENLPDMSYQPRTMS